VLLLASCI